MRCLRPLGWSWWRLRIGTVVELRRPIAESSPFSLPSGQEYLQGPVCASRASGCSLCRCFSYLKRTEYVLKNDEAERKEIEEMVGFTYEPSLEILALMDVILNRIGLKSTRKG